MKNIHFVIYKEKEFFVSQCLDVDVSSFGTTVDEAKKNIIEAVELYFQDSEEINIPFISNVSIGEAPLYA